MISTRMRRAILALALTAGAALGVSNAAQAATYYQLQVLHSNKCLSGSLGSTNGRPAIQDMCYSSRLSYSPIEHWELLPAGPASTYILRNRANMRCLDVQYWSRLHAAPVIMANCHGLANQQWYLSRLIDGSYRLRAVHSNKCLDVWQASPDSGVPILQANCSNPGYHQRWRLRAPLP